MPCTSDSVVIEKTVSLCNECMARIDAALIERDGKIYLEKTCPAHGRQVALFEEDASWHRRKKHYLKPGTKTTVQTASERGCPYDCGLCPDHRQHACIGLVEVTNACNLACEVCYADGHADGAHLPTETILRMIDFFAAAECGTPEILQLSGGEPTLHPGILDIIRYARTKVKYVMLNTNGLRLTDEDFVRQLVFDNKFEVYMQFDGTDELRGRSVHKTKLRALELLKQYGIPCTLVCTVTPGVNEHLLGEIIQFGLNQDGVRGINFQPVTFFGRLPEKLAIDLEHRLTLSGVLKRIYAQAGLKSEDFVPLPCNPYRVAVSYFVKTAAGPVSVCPKIPVEKALPFINNTLAFNADELLATGPLCSCLGGLFPKAFAKSLAGDKKNFLNSKTFRVTVTSFVDRYNFDENSIKQECVQVITPDNRRIPFSAYNMIHRHNIQPVAAQ